MNRNVIPPCFSTVDNKAKHRHAMMAANTVDALAAKAVLTADNNPMGKKKAAADALQDACMQCVLELEVKLKLRNAKVPLSSRTKPTTMAIAMRHQKGQTAKTKREQKARKKQRLDVGLAACCAVNITIRLDD